MLYVRMFFMLAVGLFTSRIVLEALGEDDFGVYNVVGGVVAMFTVISGALNAAISRFITFELGKGGERLSKVYSSAVTVQLILSLVIVLVAEPAGLWFIDNMMTIDPARIPAARLVLHFSLFSFVVNLMSVPQMALITAHEKMSAYAWIGILDGVLRLGVAVAVLCSSADRLVLYAALMALSVLAVRGAYGLYCRRCFPECRYRPLYDAPLLKEMSSFAGWNFIGAASGVLRDQGGNILLNVFFNPAVNAARGVALQLNNAVQGFVTNFMIAVNPQLTKSYASGEHKYMFSLMKRASRMSFYLLLVLSLPILFNTESVLAIWLKDVPEHTFAFVRLFLVFTLSESISYPLITVMLATGDIKKYQIVVGGLQILNLPLSYLLLKAGYPPESTVAVAIALSQICLFARLVMLKGMIGLSVKDFMIKVYFNLLLVAALSCVPPALLNGVMPSGIAGLGLGVAVCVLSAAVSAFYAGCSSKERKELLEMIKLRVRHDKD